MERIGVVKKYNGEYGFIESDNEIIDFSCEDISFGLDIKTGDIVKFRVETKFYDIKIARGVCLVCFDDLKINNL